MRNSECFSARSLRFSDNSEARTNIEDLETSLNINKILLKDSLQLKKSESDESGQHMITSKLLKNLETENSRIQNSISNMLEDISKANYSLLLAEEKINNSRKRKKEEVAKKNTEMELLKIRSIEKEAEIREAEKELKNLNETLEFLNTEKNPSLYEVLRMQEKMLQVVKDQLLLEESRKRMQYEECLELHEDLKREQLRSKLALPDTLKNLQKIVNKNYCTDNKFFWMFLKDQNFSFNKKSRSLSQSSADFKFSDTVKHISKNKPKVPPLKLSSQNNINSEILEQKLLFQLLSSEISALTSILNQLESYETTLNHKFY